MKNCKYDFDCRFAAFVHIYRYTAPIVGYGNTIIFMNSNFHVRAVSRQRFVNTIIHNFIH